MMFLIETSQSYTCGDVGFNFSGMIPYVVHMIVLIIKIVIPIILIIFGMIDFLKAVTAAKEDEIKKGQQTFIKRLIAAVIVFFVVQIVQLVVSFVGKGSDSDSISGCFDCFVNNTEDSNGATGCLPPASSADNSGG